MLFAAGNAAQAARFSCLPALATGFSSALLPMFSSLADTRLLRHAGLFTWGTVGVPLLYSLWLAGEGVAVPDTPEMGLYGWLAYLLYAPMFFWLTLRLAQKRRSRLGDLALLAGLLAASVALGHFSGSALGSILMVITATTLPWCLPVALGVSLLALSQLVMVPLLVYGQGFPWPTALLQTVVYIGFSAFSFATGLVTKQQADGREAQRRMNGELLATRTLLADSSRANERIRIARELHDLLGHHLTILSLNLEVAGHLCSGKAAESVRQAHVLARLLLTDVREVVSQLREDTAIDIAAALRLLTEQVSGLEIALDVPEGLTMEDAGRAHVLLRAVQEIITNTLRHAGARRLGIRIRQQGQGLVLDARDDGRGTGQLVPGHGLRGLSERLAPYRGQLRVDSRPGEGFVLHLLLPLDATPHPLEISPVNEMNEGAQP